VTAAFLTADLGPERKRMVKALLEVSALCGLSADVLGIVAEYAVMF